jgi:hypothetical protein
MLWRLIARWTVILGLAGGFGGLLIGELFLRAEREVRYAGALGFSRCVGIAGEPACSFRYRLSVGNTGTVGQDGIRVVLPPMPPRASVTTAVSDIVASAQRTPQPATRQQDAGGGTLFTIAGLAPNTLVDIDVDCALCASEHLTAFNHARPVVEAQGAVIQGDPRVASLRSALGNLLRVLRLF